MPEKFGWHILYMLLITLNIGIAIKNRSAYLVNSAWKSIGVNLMKEVKIPRWRYMLFPFYILKVLYLMGKYPEFRKHVSHLSDK